MTTPLDIFTTWQKTVTENMTKGPNPMQMWQKAVTDFWQAPATYWQSVASVMNHNTTTLGGMASTAPEMLKTFSSCKSWPEFVGAAMNAQGKMATEMLNASLTNATLRTAMAKNLGALASRNMPGLNGWLPGTSAPSFNAAPSFVPPQAAAAPAPVKAAPVVAKPVVVVPVTPVTQPRGTFIPAAPTKTTPISTPTPKAESRKPITEKLVLRAPSRPAISETPTPEAKAKLFKTVEQPSVRPTPSVAFTAGPVISGNRKPLFTQLPNLAVLPAAQAAQTQPKTVLESKPVLASNVTPITAAITTQGESSDDTPLLTGTTGAPVVSSTATSVMRAASGATIAAAAAARRSVVARRQTRARRPR